MEVQRLEALGLQTISHKDIPTLEGKRMLIRAHGEPPKTYDLAKRYGVEVVDATCPVVAALQRKVKKAYEEMERVGGSVVILGKRGHAEVVGLTGQVDEKAIVVECEEDLEQVDFSRPIYFLSQTTQSVEKFRRLAEKMRQRLPNEAMLTADDTICRRVSSREEHLREFARQHDIIIFVCGRKSSNGKVLYNICQQENERSYNIEEAGELQKPTSPNGYKFETLVLDMVHMMKDCLSYEIDRNKEFAPIKNLEGVDSLVSARELLRENGVEL